MRAEGDGGGGVLERVKGRPPEYLELEWTPLRAGKRKSASDVSFIFRIQFHKGPRLRTCLEIDRLTKGVGRSF